MSFKILTEYDFDRKLFNELEGKCTDFARRDGKEYDGWCVELVDCNGAESAIYRNNGEVETFSLTDPYIGIRPAIEYSKIKDYGRVVKTLTKDVIEVECGEYPQEKVSDEQQEQLTKELLDGKLDETGKKYTIYNNDEQNPNTYKLIEIMDKNGRKYVFKDDGYWYKVSPVRWIVSEKIDLALTKYMVQGGIPYGEYIMPPMEEWEIELERRIPRKLPMSVIRMHELRRTNPTIIEGFLNTVLSDDLLPINIKDKENNSVRKKSYDKTNIVEQKIPVQENRYNIESLNDLLLRGEVTVPSEECLRKLLESLDDENIKMEAAKKYLHPRLQEEYIEGKRALRKTLLTFKQNK